MVTVRFHFQRKLPSFQDSFPWKIQMISSNGWLSFETYYYSRISYSFHWWNGLRVGSIELNTRFLELKVKGGRFSGNLVLLSLFLCVCEVAMTMLCFPTFWVLRLFVVPFSFIGREKAKLQSFLTICPGKWPLANEFDSHSFHLDSVAQGTN